MADLLYTKVADKYTNDAYTETFDFEGHLPAGVTISSRVVTAVDDTGTSAPTVIASSAIVSLTITVAIATLTINMNYLVKVVVTGSDTKTYTQTMLLRVYDPAVLA
jgi:hypothetical protein